MFAIGGKADVLFANPDHVFDDWTDWFEPCPLSGVSRHGPLIKECPLMTQGDVRTELNVQPLREKRTHVGADDSARLN
jgi:hypothetical protein